MEGTPLAELPGLHTICAELLFGWSAERLVERGHATIERKATHAPFRSEAYDSLSLRMPQLIHDLNKEEAEGQATLWLRLGGALDQWRNPKQMLASLGLHRHPSIYRSHLHSWDKLYRKVLYHADPISLYRMRTPIDLDDDDNNDGPGPRDLLALRNIDDADHAPAHHPPGGPLALPASSTAPPGGQPSASARTSLEPSTAIVNPLPTEPTDAAGHVAQADDGPQDPSIKVDRYCKTIAKIMAQCMSEHYAFFSVFKI